MDGDDDGQWFAEPIRDQDINTLGIAYSRGTVALARKLQEIQRATVVFKDDFDISLLSKGDKVTVIDKKTNLDGTFRIKQLQRRWDRKGETVTAQLANRIRVDSTFAFIAEINTLKRQQ